MDLSSVSYSEEAQFITGGHILIHYAALALLKGFLASIYLIATILFFFVYRHLTEPLAKFLRIYVLVLLIVRLL